MRLPPILFTFLSEPFHALGNGLKLLLGELGQMLKIIGEFLQALIRSHLGHIIEISDNHGGNYRDNGYRINRQNNRNNSREDSSSDNVSVAYRGRRSKAEPKAVAVTLYIRLNKPNRDRRDEEPNHINQQDLIRARSFKCSDKQAPPFNSFHNNHTLAQFPIKRL